MPPKILRRCDRCYRWGAAYLVQDAQLGTLRLCYRCWKAQQTAEQTAQSGAASLPEPEEPSSQPTCSKEETT